MGVLYSGLPLLGHVNKKFDSSGRLPKHHLDLQIGLQLLLNRHHSATRWVSGQIQLRVAGHELAVMTVDLRVSTHKTPPRTISCE
ncbi:hypothetical protein N7466_007398 [Penicillium verhagenii]|uniref:uncharacterized protein n=1 Tax=Penicillium verhagenii TaxID=1562060 RepID=UPI002545121B|nr:uncharacterized protein N7466_007398 [Penicillium verhagenii]KAJ5928442.1 hypothetical protein N7466_007398 [Penicillium verhagenii]